MFGYVRRWLALGLVCPRASSFIERTMRAIGRRIKKLGYNWKDEGVGKIARIVLKQFATEGEWEEYWRKRMDLNQSLMLNFKVLEVQYWLCITRPSSQTLPHYQILSVVHSKETINDSTVPTSG